MKKPHEFERYSPAQRRRFLKLMGAALAAPGIPAAVRFACNDMLLGEAQAQAAEQVAPTYFIEINYRDQVDLGEVFVAPGLATYSNLIRGEQGRMAAMFVQMNDLQLRTVTTPNSQPIYLTPDAMALEPYLENIAWIDTCELTPGAIHYHQAANRNRIPDCDYNEVPGKLPVYTKDPISNFPQGCEAFYGSVPTPASLHNYVQKNFTGSVGLRNGVALKGISRSIHTVYHFGGTLDGAELDRFKDKESLFAAFPDTTSEPIRHLPTKDDVALFNGLLQRLDKRFMERRNYAPTAISGHQTSLTESQELLYSDIVRTISLPLTQAEIEYWKTGVPEPGTQEALVEGQDGQDFNAIKFQIWEQYAFAFKLVSSGFTRTVALECEFVDIHDKRPRNQMTVHTKQLALPLARLIESLKMAGIWDQTVIAIYTADGSRSPAAGSAGNEGKNTFILAGGKVKGGYFGDVGVSGMDGNGHKYSFSTPDPITGAPTPAHEEAEHIKRLAGGYSWRTVAEAFGTPASVLQQIASPKISDVQPLRFLLA
jgi:hypothetical protein